MDIWGHKKLANPLYVALAQLDRVPGYEPGGREFESLMRRQICKALCLTAEGLFLLLGKQNYLNLPIF